VRKWNYSGLCTARNAAKREEAETRNVSVAIVDNRASRVEHRAASSIVIQSPATIFTKWKKILPREWGESAVASPLCIASRAVADKGLDNNDDDNNHDQMRGSGVARTDESSSPGAGAGAGAGAEAEAEAEAGKTQDIPSILDLMLIAGPPIATDNHSSNPMS
jgi:hypothetical protein